MAAFDDKERAALYAHLRSFESDFDKSQSQMRAICSAWSAAVLGAIALTVTSASTPPTGISCDMIMHRADTLAYLRSLICMIGSAGVFAFWFVDQQIYQRLLHSVFGYGLYLECAAPDLPQVRSTLFIANLDITNGLAWFYRTQFWTFALIACVFVAQPFDVDLGSNPKGIKAISEIHLAGVFVGELYSRRWPSLRTLINKVFGPDFAQKLPTKQPRWNWSAGLTAICEAAWVALCNILPKRPNLLKPPIESDVTTAWLTRVRNPPLPKR
jgi:hypothetical protein